MRGGGWLPSVRQNGADRFQANSLAFAHSRDSFAKKGKGQRVLCFVSVMACHFVGTLSCSENAKKKRATPVRSR